MSRRNKLFRRMQGPEKKNIRFDEVRSLLEYYGATCSARGADFVFRHPHLPGHLFVGKPHGGRDTMRPHDVDRVVEAIEYLIEAGVIQDLGGEPGESHDTD